MNIAAKLRDALETASLYIAKLTDMPTNGNDAPVSNVSAPLFMVDAMLDAANELADAEAAHAA